MGNAGLIPLSDDEKAQALLIRKACEKGDHFELARLLRTCRRGPGSPCDAIDWENWRTKGSALCSSAVHYAARGGHDKCLELLFEHGANMHQYDFRGFTPVHEVCLGKRKISTLAYLIKACKCSINVKNASDYWTPVHIAANDNAPELLEFILQNGGWVDSRTRNGSSTPLHLSTKNRAWKCGALLIKYGASEKDTDSQGNPPTQSPEIMAAIRLRETEAENRRTQGLPPLPPQNLEPNPLSVGYYACAIQAINPFPPAQTQPVI